MADAAAPDAFIEHAGIIEDACIKEMDVMTQDQNDRAAGGVDVAIVAMACNWKRASASRAADRPRFGAR